VSLFSSSLRKGVSGRCRTDVLHLVDLHLGVQVLPGEGLIRDDLEEVDEVDTILEGGANVVHGDGPLVEVRVDPLGEGLHLHRLPLGHQLLLRNLAFSHDSSNRS